MGKIMAGQVEHTPVASKEMAGLTFGEMMDTLVTLYGVREHERARFVARVNKVQRAGVPIGTNKGKGARVRYNLDQFFQMVVVLELAELSISLNNAAGMVLREWPHFTASLAIASAWLKREEDDSILLLASASELEGFAEQPNYMAARDAEARRFLVSAPDRPMDGLTMVSAHDLIRNGRFDLAANSLNRRLWRTSIIDMSTLVPLAVRTLEEKGFVSEGSMTAWARQRWEEYERAE